MAEIELQRKKKPVWPWIVGIILAALLIWGLISLLDNDKDTDEIVAEQPVVTDTTAGMVDNDVAATGAVSAFVAWANNGESAEMGKHHNYTAEGLRKLSAAIEELSNRKFAGDADVSSAVSKMKASANQIQDDWKSDEHANEIKSAFSASVDAMEKIQQKSEINVKANLESLRSKANAMDKQTLTLDQKGAVKAFFTEAAAVLQQMDRQ